VQVIYQNSLLTQIAQLLISQSPFRLELEPGKSVRVECRELMGQVAYIVHVYKGDHEYLVITRFESSAVVRAIEELRGPIIEA
jgi:hypothetical protein